MLRTGDSAVTTLLFSSSRNLERDLISVTTFVLRRWDGWHSCTTDDPACHPIRRFLYAVWSSSSHWPRLMLASSGTVDVIGWQFSIPAALSKSPDSIHSFSFCDERHCREMKEVSEVDWKVWNHLSTHHSPMWKTRGPRTTIACNLCFKHCCETCCSDQSQL